VGKSLAKIMGPLPEVQVRYDAQHHTLSLWNGMPAVEGEEVAKGLTVHYDAEGSVVAVDLDGAQLVLKPFLDALAKNKD
jgi:uncharacterized protein YuzE